MGRFKKFFMVMGFGVLVFPLFGEPISPFTMPSARFGAMGGTHAAFADDFYSLFTNPAGFVGVEDQWSVAELSISTYGPVFEIMNLVSQSTGTLESLDLTGIISPKGFAAGFDMGGPVSLGWVGRGLGLGIFNRTKTDIVLSGTKLRPKVSEDILLVGGYSFRLINQTNHVFDAGFLGKGFFRGTMNMDTSLFNIMDMLQDPLNHPLTTYLGLGLDLGLRYTFAGALSAALVCYDVYSPALATNYDSYDDFINGINPGIPAYTTVARRLALGFAYKIKSPFLDRYISSLSVMADYKDFLDLLSLIPRNPILNVGIGVELVVLNVLSLRLGIADALPAAGFGIDLSYFKLDCAIHGKELGLDPGLQPVYALDIGLLFRY